MTKAPPWTPTDSGRPTPTGRPDHWSVKPQVWRTPEEQLLDGETHDVILEAIDMLPPRQKIVITLRDIEGWDSEEVRNALELSETNQRVLLHRARSKVRAALEAYDNELQPTE